MGRALDITGERYGRLVAVCNTGKRQLRNFIWNFRCDCGAEIECAAGEVRRGRVSSCGCLRSEMGAEHFRTNAAEYNRARTVHGMTKSPEYISWDSMKQRCLNVSHKSYKDYGGRGITVCERWIDSFENFLSDMGERPRGMTLDRIDTDGNYEPSNCRWATAKIQANNRRNSRYITYMDKTATLKQWADDIGISNKALAYRLANGWSVKEALTMKKDYGNEWMRGVSKL